MELTKNNTFCMLKPDITKRNLIGSLITEIEKYFKIIKIESKTLSIKQAEEFYKDHKEKFFFNDMVNRISSAMVVGCILEIKDVNKDGVIFLREIMGATNPANAAEGTIRKLYAISIDDNSIHGSDSIENAKRESEIFFENK